VELDSLRELYVDELKDLYSAENQILKALPRMIKASSNRELQRAFTQHEKVTRRQVQRLERIFKDLDESPRGKKCVGMEGLIQEGKELISEKPDPEVLDAGLISKAQHIEHYEMAGYGTVRTWAQQLGLDKHVELLQATLDEEGDADKTLTQLAESTINVQAEQEADVETVENADMPSSGRGARGGTRRTARGTGRSPTRPTGAMARAD
jgi:ferritin-like metal-binding protein YciE